MEFIQKRFRTKYTFTLHDDYFNYAYEESSGYGDIDVNYADVPKKYAVKIEESFFVALIAVVCYIQFFYYVTTDAAILSKAFWIAAAMLSSIITQSLKTKYSVLQTERGAIFVIQNENHDEIIEELNKRKKDQLLAWYGQINPENDLQAEIQKINWLVEQEAMSKEDSEQKIAEAELLKKESYEFPGEKLN